MVERITFSTKILNEIGGRERERNTLLGDRSACTLVWRLCRGLEKRPVLVERQKEKINDVSGNKPIKGSKYMRSSLEMVPEIHGEPVELFKNGCAVATILCTCVKNVQEYSECMIKSAELNLQQLQSTVFIT